MRHRFDLVEVVVIAFVAAAIVAAIMAAPSEPLQHRRAAILGADGAAELQVLADRYGAGRYSRNAEEWAVRDFFQDKRDGVFLDVGANDYRRENNTYFLETTLGWHGLAIDAQAEYAAGYAKFRPRTKFFALFVSDVSGTTADLFVPGDADHLTASGSAAFAGPAGSTSRRQVPTLTLTDLLLRERVDHVDFVSMDIELAEPKALAGFDIQRFQPALVCVEAHPQVRQAVLDYFERHAYVVVVKYLRLDTQNLYFVPGAVQH